MRSVLGIMILFVIFTAMIVGIIFMEPSFQSYVINGLTNSGLNDPTSGVMIATANITSNTTSKIVNVSSQYVLVFFILMFVAIMMAVYAYVKVMR